MMSPSIIGLDDDLNLFDKDLIEAVYSVMLSLSDDPGFVTAPTPSAQASDPRFGPVAMIIRDICELDQDDPNNPQTICINIDTLERIVDEHVQSEPAQEDEPIAVVINNNQPG